MIVMGLDVATHLGVALWSEGVIVHREVLFFKPEEAVRKTKLNHPDRFIRYTKYATAVEDLLDQWAVTHVFLEGYGYANAHTLVTLVELGALVRQALHDRGTRWVEVPPGTLKKFITGKGTAKKNTILLEVYKRFGIECTSDDEADAVALAYFGAVQLGQPVPLPKDQLDVARGLDKRKKKT